MKQFLIVGGVANAGYLETFNLIKNNIVKYRPNRIHKFENGVAVAATWYTTMETPYIPPLELTKSYNPEDYPKYDNYDAIEVSKTINIPYDYDGVMGVPITFLDKYCPEQFEIIGLDRYVDGNKCPNKRMFIDGKEIYARILIRHHK